MITKTNLNDKELSKIKLDLDYLEKIIEFSQKHHFRLVVSGGYALDGVLNAVTRPHGDIDIILYGKFPRNKVIQLIKEFILSHYPTAKFSREPNPFSECLEITFKGFRNDLYYVQTINDPSKDILTIKLIDGKIQINTQEQFPPPVKVELSGISFEVQDPNLLLADILFKRKNRQKLIKHKQDITNLRGITDKSKVKLLLKFYK